MSVLFSPIEVKSIRFRNRVVMPPMVSGNSNLDGLVTDAIIDHYRQRAEAGTGTIIVEATNVDESGRPWAKGLGAWHDDQVEGLTSLARVIHEYGSVAAIQLVHGGPQASPDMPGVSVVGPSTVPHSAEARPPRALTVEEIGQIEERFAAAAARCTRAGFDAVEAHGAHGYLLDSFLSSHSNRRTDRYGGDIPNRMRMLLETCARMRKRIGDRALLICRISLFNKGEGEFGIGEYRQLVGGLESAGADMLHISTDGAFRPYFGEEKTLGQWAKSIFRMPVIVAGGLGDPADAERAVAAGHCDFAAVGNAMYEDAKWTEKARHALGA
jgi:2,4-dienoyl-CoA reductase-like NADH-dependent reductase (Old Yellow Enzyme family)